MKTCTEIVRRLARDQSLLGDQIKCEYITGGSLVIEVADHLYHPSATLLRSSVFLRRNSKRLPRLGELKSCL